MTNITEPHKRHENPQQHVREQPLAKTHTACTKLHGPSQISHAPIPDMRSSPRARIALIGEPLLLKQLQPIEARQMKKR